MRSSVGLIVHSSTSNAFECASIAHGRPTAPRVLPGAGKLHPALATCALIVPAEATEAAWRPRNSQRRTQPA